jgi:NRPS condensation-like uncharacterized protein
MAMTSWFKIDNAGKLFPVVSNDRRSSYFRLTMTLHEIIDPTLLQKAAELTLQRFPNFNTRLRRGLFWYYLETQQKPFKVKPDPNLFGSISEPNNPNNHLIEIYYHRDRIAIEVFHSITDGRGGMEFLKTLTLAYLKLKQYPVHAEGMMFDSDDEVSTNELEDSFAKKIKPGLSEWLPTKKAYHLKGDYFPHHGHYLTHAKLSVQETVAIAKKHGTTVTGFLAAVIMYELVVQQNLENPKKRRPIILSIPVDMRKYLPSTTMKNFVMTINIGQVFPPQTTFDDVLKVVIFQLKEGQSLDKLAPQIRANMKAERMLLIRFIPLFLKRILIQYVFNRVGEPALTFAMSNLGKLSLPESVKPYVVHAGFMICSSKVMPINLGVVSHDDVLMLNFSRIMTDRDFLRRLLIRFHDTYGLSMEVSGNRWEEHHD